MNWQLLDWQLYWREWYRLPWSRLEPPDVGWGEYWWTLYCGFGPFQFRFVKFEKQ
jgi:hypothetical protein